MNLLFWIIWLLRVKRKYTRVSKCVESTFSVESDGKINIVPKVSKDYIIRHLGIVLLPFQLSYNSKTTLLLLGERSDPRASLKKSDELR